MLYHTLAESVISYGLSSYGRTFKSYVDSMYSLQIRFVKMIVPEYIKVKLGNDIKLHFKFCGIIPIHDKINYVLLKENFFCKDIQRKVTHKIITRQISNKQLIVSKTNNFYGKRTCENIIPHLLNKLPRELIDTINHLNIKHKLKTYFLEQLQ